VLADADLTEGSNAMRRSRIPVLLYRRQDGCAPWRPAAMGARWQKAVGGSCVTCPARRVFRFADGGIVRGPASAPQPRYEAQIRDGQIGVIISP
jgi:hypothetical protein